MLSPIKRTTIDQGLSVLKNRVYKPGLPTGFKNRVYQPVLKPGLPSSFKNRVYQPGLETGFTNRFLVGISIFNVHIYNT